MFPHIHRFHRAERKLKKLTAVTPPLASGFSRQCARKETFSVLVFIDFKKMVSKKRSAP